MIGVLGCGWLGLPLAKELVLQGFTVKGTTTTQSKLEDIAAIGAVPCMLSLQENGVAGDVETFFSGLKVLVINIPPGLRKATTEESYVRKIDALSKVIEAYAIEKVIFVSSISVYGTQQGAVDETVQPLPETESGKQLLQCETVLSANKNFETAIVRMAGLLGEQRHPVKFLAGKQNVANANHYVHLIHLEDCVGILTKIIKTNSFPFLLNAVFPVEISREEYYTKEAKQLGLVPPVFSNEPSKNKGKRIIANNVSLLNYSFKNSIFT